MGVGRSYLEWGGPIADYQAYATAILRGAIWEVGCCWSLGAVLIKPGMQMPEHCVRLLVGFAVQQDYAVGHRVWGSQEDLEDAVGL